MRKVANRSYWNLLASFCWYRAHKATDPRWRTRYFDAFEVAITFRDMV